MPENLCPKSVPENLCPKTVPEICARKSWPTAGAPIGDDRRPHVPSKNMPTRVRNFFFLIKRVLCLHWNSVTKFGQTIGGTFGHGIFWHNFRARHSGTLFGQNISGTIFGHTTPNFRRHFRARDPDFSATFSGTRPPIFGHPTPMWQIGLFRALAGAFRYSCSAPIFCIAPPRHHSYSRRPSLYDSCNGYDIVHTLKHKTQQH